MLPLRMLELRFGFDGPPSEFDEAIAPLVGEFASVPGLVWKIWLMDEARREAGGICLFADHESVEAFRCSRLLAEVKEHPAITELEAREFEIIADLTSVTRGPVRGMEPLEPAVGSPAESSGGTSRFRERRSGRDRRAGFDRRRGGDRRRTEGAIAHPDRRSGEDRRRGERRALAGAAAGKGLS